MIPTNFISHTVGAITILPVVALVGKDKQIARSMVVGGVLCCSASCALPVSSFPNVIAYSITDGAGTKFLEVTDYLQLGVIVQTFIYTLNVTLGWAIFHLLGW
eukprot:TRINITY_DN2227_c0_g1_i1.p1 TRINITY_DN2227_c0_g1~~TRINITY_DN2227_c0_g1_i1.p1  ORF type:complete len:103 (+),score=5.59 TRINITY_DN2227_c0_g1_i1:244-552(+)